MRVLMVGLVSGLVGCAPSGVELSETEVFIEVPQEGDALQRATVLADNLFSYPVRIAATDNGPAQVPVDVGAAITSIDAESSGEWGLWASLSDNLEVGESFSYTLTTKVYRCESEDLDTCRSEQGEENPLQTLTMQVTTEIVPTP